MRKLKLFFACLLMAVLSIGQVWAAEELKATIDFSSNDFSIPTSKTVAENTYTHDGISMTLTGTSGNGYAYYLKDKYLLNGKQGATITFSAFEWKTTKIVVTGRSGASGSTKMNIFVGENAVSTETTGCTGTNTYNIASTSQAAGTIYTLKVTSAHNAQFTKFEIYGEDAVTPAKTLTSIAVSGTPTKTSYESGENFDPAGLVVTGTYSDASSSPITSGITWSYNPSQTLALNQTSIGVTATVGEVSSAEYNVTGLTVSEGPDVTLDLLDAGWGFPTSKVVDETAYTNGGYTIKVAGSEGNGFRVYTGQNILLGKQNAYIELPIFSSPIKKIVVAGNSGGSGATVWNIFQGENAVSTAATGCTADSYTFNIAPANQKANVAHMIKVISEHNLQIKSIKIYFGEASSKQAAGLAYAAADAQKLVKVGGTLEAPTLTNPNTLTVSYASSDEAVVKVNASTGAITEIAAAGKAVITASFAGNDDFFEDEVSYTIFVAEQAGTEADPLTEASAKALIDLGCTVTAHVNGVVASATYNSTYKNYGVTLTNGFQFYHLKDLNNADFSSGYLKINDELTAVGALKKYNSTYELDEGCYLTSYVEFTEPLISIANTKETAYTVAQALAFATAPTTYDLADHVYIQGVVYDVKNFNSTNGTYDIYIKDASVENKFEFHNCKGLYQEGDAVVPFENGDVQVGNIVIGYGVMTYYSGGQIWEFNAGDNHLVDLQAPVTGIELDATAEVEEGSTVNLTATILPSNTTGTIVWSVQSGSDYASVAAGVVTGKAEGEAVIRATVEGTAFYAECTVTVTAAAAPDTRKIANGPAAFTTTSGNLTPADIAYTAYQGGASTAPAIYNDGIRLYQISGSNDFGGFVTLTAKAGCTIDEVQITTTSKYATTVAYSKDGNETLLKSESVAASSSYTTGTGLNASSVNILNLGTGSDGRLEIASIKVYYTGEAATIDHYELGGTYQTAFMQDEEFNHTGLIVYAVYDALGENKVDITSMCTFSEPDMSTTGEKTIEITYNEAVVISYTINVAADSRKVAESPATFTAVSGDMNPADITFAAKQGGASTAPANYNDGIRLYQAPSADVIGGFITLKAKKGCTIDQVKITTTNSYATTVAYSVDGNENLLGSESVAKSSDYSTPSGLNVESVNIVNKGTGSSGRLEIASIKVWYTGDALPVHHYILGGTYATEFEQYGAFSYEGLTVTAAYDELETITEAVTGFTVEADLSTAGEKKAEVMLNSVKIAEYDITVTASAKVDPELAYNPASVILTKGDALSAPVLSNEFVVSPISFVSDKPAVATVDAEGNISLAGGIGVAVITASFAGNDDYLASEATFTITVNEPAEDLSGTWVVATSIAAGDRIIIADVAAAGAVYTMGGQNSNNRAAVASTVDEYGVLTPAEGTKTFLVVDAENGEFALQALNDNYLYAASTSSNHLKETSDINNVNAKWTITIENGIATIKALHEGHTSRNWMRKNSSDAIFSCYGSGQNDIVIYKIGTPDYGSYQRNVTSGNYGTICLPKAGVISGATLFEIANYENDMIYVDEILSGEMVAGRPYIFQATSDQLNVVYSSAATEETAGNHNGLYGFYNLSNENAQYDIPEDAGNYILYQNAYWLVSGREAYIANYRAYIKLGQINNTGAQAPGRRRVAMTVHGEQVVTGIDAFNAAEAPVKVMINGQIFILRGEKMYDATGRLVK